MLKLSKKVEYALIAIKHMSTQEGDELSSARELAEHYHVSPDILGKVMQKLNRADIVESIQGARGGYRLRKPTAILTVGEVIEAIDGPVHVAPCAGSHYSCQQESSCNIKQPINQLQYQLQSFIFSLTLDALNEKNPLPLTFPSVDTLTEDTDHVLLKQRQ